MYSYLLSLIFKTLIYPFFEAHFLLQIQQSFSLLVFFSQLQNIIVKQ